MNRYLSYIATMLLLAFSLSSCEEEEGSLGPAPTSDQIQFSSQPDATNPNIIRFKANAPGFKAVWDLGNGETATGNEVVGKYPLKGEYTVTLTMYTSGGSASNNKKITVANTNASMLNRPDYNFLTGGANELNGKTWVIDKEGPGHLGVGPSEGSTPEWYKAAANEKAGLGLYDDEMVFNLNGFAYTYKNNGDTFANGAHAQSIGGDASGDQKVAYTPKTGLTWTITDEGDKKFLTISNGGFFGYYTGVSRYEILALSENELYVKQLDSKNGALAWYQRLVPKGYTRPVVVKPYKEAADLKDNFDTPGNINWAADAGLVFNTKYDNPAPLSPNTSAKVGQYIKPKGGDNAFANLQTTLGHKIDLTSKNKIRLKVFMPSYNDYTTEDGFDWAVKNLLKQVSVKLQNSESGAPWETQVEVKKQVNQLDKWVEFTFDFSSASARKDLDRIVIQIGGEGHFNGGIFYIDDIELIK